MTTPRNTLISLEDTPYYHVISRCVRRAFLCGNDRYTNQNYDHRNQWFIEHLQWLSTVFSIHIASYAVMSNHYHLVLCIDDKSANSLTEESVVEQWRKLFKIPPFVDEYLKQPDKLSSHREAAQKVIQTYRSRLFSISWFMRCLNEHIARRANKEDKCKGRFWEGRFKSQALLDEKALLACMAYVDLNPIRAGTANTPEDSDYTSIQYRISAPKNWLLRFDDQQLATEVTQAIPYNLLDYLQLVDWTGRILRHDKRGAIPTNSPLILERLGIDANHWIKSLAKPMKYTAAIGAKEHINQYCQHIKNRWLNNTKEYNYLYLPPN